MSVRSFWGSDIWVHIWMKGMSKPESIWGISIVEGRKSKFKDCYYCDFNTFSLRVLLIATKECFCSNITSARIPPKDL